jgi:hypothetical protein
LRSGKPSATDASELPVVDRRNGSRSHHGIRRTDTIQELDSVRTLVAKNEQLARERVAPQLLAHDFGERVE